MSQNRCNLMVELTKKTSLPMELWMIIFEKKDKLEHIDWTKQMEYLFSNEFSGASPYLRTSLRSGRTFERNNTGGSRLYNLATQCLCCDGYKNSGYCKMKGILQLVKNYYIWMYKRDIWCCEIDCRSDKCAPWCKFSKKRKQNFVHGNTSWQRFFETVDQKIDSMIMSVMRDYSHFQSTEHIKKILYKKDPNYYWDTWEQDEEQWEIAQYELVRRRLVRTYNTIPMFLKCVGFAKKLDYFKYRYFRNWKNGKMTQEDFQFELCIYRPSKWKKYLSECHKLRSGKLIGPKLYGLAFSDDC